jgi:hypothetical protein
MTRTMLPGHAPYRRMVGQAEQCEPEMAMKQAIPSLKPKSFQVTVISVKTVGVENVTARGFRADATRRSLMMQSSEFRSGHTGVPAGQFWRSILRAAVGGTPQFSHPPMLLEYQSMLVSLGRNQYHLEGKYVSRKLDSCC